MDRVRFRYCHIANGPPRANRREAGFLIKNAPRNRRGANGKALKKRAVALLTYVQSLELKILIGAARTAYWAGFNAKPCTLATKVEYVCQRRNL